MIDDDTAAAELIPEPASAVAEQPTGALRFAAPGDVAGINFSTGRSFAVADGVLTTPDDLSDTEKAALRSTGFTPA